MTLRDLVKRALLAISHMKRIRMIDKIYSVALNDKKHLRKILKVPDYKRFFPLWEADFPGQGLVTRQTETGGFHPEVMKRVTVWHSLLLRGSKMDVAITKNSPI